MNRDLQGLWIARLARDPLLVSGLLLPVWCVGARTRFLMTRCTIPTFVNVFAGNLFIRLTIWPFACKLHLLVADLSPICAQLLYRYILWHKIAEQCVNLHHI